MKRVIVPLLATALLALAPTGCKMASGIQRGGSSHVAFPNSNITPLGPVKASAMAGPTLFAPSYETGKESEAMFDEAVASVDGANMVIDYVKTFDMYLLPLWFIQIYWTNYELEGTAAKMEVGEQRLR